MKALATLIRLAKERVEEARRAFAEGQARHARAVARIADLETHVASEQVEAAKAQSVWSTYGAFAAVRARDRRLLEADERACAEAAYVLRDALTAAHVDLKKLEKLAELEAARAAERQLRREQAELDEAATLRAARRTS